MSALANMPNITERPATLMCKDRQVFTIDDSGARVFARELVPLNLDLTCDGTISSLVRVRVRWLSWCGSRMLSVDRRHYKKIVNVLGVEQIDSDENRAAAALTYRVMSLNDSYWVYFHNDEDQPRWRDISLRHNSLSKVVAVIALAGSSLTLSMRSARQELTAELSTHGSYPKGWFRTDNGTLYLYKANFLSNEVDKEVCASRVIDCFNVYGSVHYDKVELEGVSCARSKLMTTDDKGIIYAGSVDSWCRRYDTNVVSFVKKHWFREFSQMMVLDYLLSNSDRHSGNWGFFQDMDSGRLLGLHDLYDHNCCFDEDAEEKDEYPSMAESGLTMKQAAEAYAAKSGLRLTKQPADDMFPTVRSRDVFWKRCRHLGLVK